MAETSMIDQQAIAWHLRLAELAADDWDAFVAWLESAPEHHAAYDRVTEAEAFLVAAAPALAMHTVAVPPSTLAPTSRRGAWQVASAAAVAGIALAAAWALWPATGLVQMERTQPGTTKQIAFADGTRIDLNGASTLAMDQSNLRTVRLESGEALFHVRHKNHPFTVEAGGFAIRDLGTVFNVELTDKTLRIDVNEGSVLFDPGGADLTLIAGEGITLDRGRSLVVQRRSRGADGWLRGEMVFEEARLDDVVAAMNRRYGIKIELSEGLQGKQFTGNIRGTGNEADDVAHFANLIGAQFHREGEAWVFTPAARAR